MTEKGMKRGQPITFRIPSDTSDRMLKQLQKLKETERRNFSSKIAELVINGMNDSLAKQREAITIPLPKGLTKEQRDWMKHEHSEALLGSIVYQLLTDPVRTASLFASLNSNSLDDAFYSREEIAANAEDTPPARKERNVIEPAESEPASFNRHIDDLDDFHWEDIQAAPEESEEEEEMADALSDFLAQMNK